MKKQLFQSDYLSPESTSLQVEEKQVVCGSVSAATESFEEIDDFEW